MYHTLASWLTTDSQLRFKKTGCRINSKCQQGIGFYSRRLGGELLEERRMLATLTVNSLADNMIAGDNFVTLREAVFASNNNGTTTDLGQTSSGADVINLSALSGSITLTAGQLNLTESVTIDGPGMDLLTIHAATNSRIFNIASLVNSPHEITIEGVTLTGGNVSGDGGAIFVMLNEDLELEINNTRIAGNSATGKGGGVAFLDQAFSQAAARLTVRQSTFFDNHAGSWGGGLFTVLNNDTFDVNDSTMSIEETTFDNNTAVNDGGGMFVQSWGGAFSSPAPTVFVEGSTFSNNDAGQTGVNSRGRGGGMFVVAADAEVTIRDTTITGNEVIDGGGVASYGFGSSGRRGSGGGAFLNVNSYFGYPYTKLTLTGITISNNEAEKHGGGIWLEALGPDLDSVTVNVNSTTISGNTSRRAGGVYLKASGATAQIQGSRITGNKALTNLAYYPMMQYGKGGGMYAFVSGYVGNQRLTVSGTTIDGNEAQFGGGGAFVCAKSYGELAVVNTTISGNKTLDASNGGGGGIWVATPGHGEGLDSRLTNVTISDNESRAGAGLLSQNLDDVHTRINNSIVSGNRNLSGGDNNLEGRFDVLNTQFNLIGTSINLVNSAGMPITTGNLHPSNIVSNNPGLGDLFPNGGFAPTHALLPGSQAIDRGSNTLDFVPFTSPLDFLETDQRGVDRRVNVPGEGPNSETVDMGAYELQGAWPALVGDYNLNGFVDAADYVIWRKQLGTSVAPFSGADGNGNGVVDSDDYQVWISNFGASSGGGATGLAVVVGDYNANGVVDDDDLAIWTNDFGSTTNLAADGNDNGIIDVGDLAVWQEMEGVTTLDTIASDFNSDGIVDSLDHDIWEANLFTAVPVGTLGDANSDGFVNYDDLEIIDNEFGRTRADILPLISQDSGGMPLEISGQAPRISNIRLGGSFSTHPVVDFGGRVGSGEQLRTVVLGGLNTIYITFNEEVLVTQGSLLVTGLGGQTIPSVIAFTYDLATQTAAWQFAEALPAGQYLVQLADSIFDLDHDVLDGEFDNPWALADAAGTSDTFATGDGNAGGEFRFRFTNLPADFNHDNIVNVDDFFIMRDSLNAGVSSGALQSDGDVNGDGAVNDSDVDLFVAQWGMNFANWPSIEPGMILVSTLVDENDGNYTLGDLSLREALAIAAANSGRETIVFRDDLAGGTVTLISALGQLAVTSDVDIVGLGASQLTITRTGAGRIFHVASDVNASIRDLKVTGGNTNEGGGIYVAGSLDLIGAHVEGNTTTHIGGGVYVSGQLYLDSSLIAANTAGIYGGGIYVAGTGSLETIDSIIDGNTADFGGGIFGHFGAGDRLKITRSTISNNSAVDGTGGGINFFSTASSGTALGTIVDSTISGNHASTSSGGLRVRYSSANVSVINTTIAYNTAGTTGGGIHLVNNPAIHLHNSIVAHNSSASSGTNNIYGNVHSSSSHNLIGFGGSGGLQDNQQGNNLLGSGESAGLAPLGHYGGATKTHALLSTSPAIDRGSDAKAMDAGDMPFTADQRGFARFIDAPNIANGNGGTVDVGAFEYSAPVLVSTLLDENDGNYQAGDLSLREALALAPALSGADTIGFVPGLAGTIELTSAFVLGSPSQVIEGGLTIEGPGADRITLDANGAPNVFSFYYNPQYYDFTVRGLKLTGAAGTAIVRDGGDNVDVTLDHVEITGNGGGVSFIYSGNLDVSNSTIAENNGLGVSLGYAYANLFNTTLSSNQTAGTVAGLSISFGSATLTNVTVTGNRADMNNLVGNSTAIGGLYAGSAGTITLHNSIVVGNLAGSPGYDLAADVGHATAYPYIGSFSSISSYNLIGSGPFSTGNNNQLGVSAAAVGLTALDYHGGSTRTHALVSTSIAIDAGDNAKALALGLENDQRGDGFERIVDWNGDLDARVDIGAFELAFQEMYS